MYNKAKVKENIDENQMSSILIERDNNIENDSESYHIKPDLVLRIKGQLVEYRDIR